MRISHTALVRFVPLKTDGNEPHIAHDKTGGRI